MNIKVNKRSEIRDGGAPLRLRLRKSRVPNIWESPTIPVYDSHAQVRPEKRGVIPLRTHVEGVRGRKPSKKKSIRSTTA